MQTIEVYHLKGPDQRLISRMWFLNKKDFDAMATRILCLAAYNSLRRDRHEACQVRFIYPRGFESDYYTDKVPPRLLQICEEYAALYNQAFKLTEKKGRLLAWLFPTAAGRHKATLKEMRKASKLLTNDDKMRL